MSFKRLIHSEKLGSSVGTKLLFKRALCSTVRTRNWGNLASWSQNIKHVQYNVHLQVAHEFPPTAMMSQNRLGSVSRQRTYQRLERVATHWNTEYKCFKEFRKSMIATKRYTTCSYGGSLCAGINRDCKYRA